MEKHKIDFNLIQKNVTIAKFHHQALFSLEFNAWWINGRMYGYKTLDYHYNMNNLMSVVKQIESLGCKFTIYTRRVTIASENDIDNVFINVKKNTKELSIFEACYKFILRDNIKCNRCDSKDMYQFDELINHTGHFQNTVTNYCKKCGNTWKTNID